MVEIGDERLNSPDLCQQCISLLRIGLLRESRGPSYSHVLAPKLCSLCLWLGHQFSSRVCEHPPGNRAIELEWSIYDDGFRIVPVDGKVEAHERIILGFESYKSDAYAEAVPFNSRESLPLGLRWLRHCLKHDRCCYNQDTQDCPAARLIFLGKINDDGVVETPRLVNSDQVEPGQPYATLSHCWGPKQIFTCIHSNFESLRYELPLAQLPQVFKDAFEVTRNAGLNYIWIDSLCIIQDSAVDWEIESKKMGDIYSNALFNVAATGFSDGLNGLFVERDPRIIKPISISIDKDLQQTDKILLEAGKHVLVNRSVWISSLQRAPLNTRSWVVQERFLARRILHFGANQLFWECPTVELCESFPTGLPAGAASDLLKVSTDLDRAGEISLGGHLAYWAAAAERYSASNLTYSSDKMVAISGLARKLQKSSRVDPGTYLGGLWTEMLLSQLTWIVVDGAQKSKPDIYRCPSWSWLSNDSPISFPEDPLPESNEDESLEDTVSYVASILKAVTIPLSRDIYGTLSGGYLNMLIPLFSLELSPMDQNVSNSSHTAGPDRDGDFLCSSQDLWINMDFKGDKNDLVTAAASSKSGTRLMWRFSKSYSQLQHFFLAPIELRDYDGDGFEAMYGLIIEPTMESVGEFRRIGAYFCYKPEVIQVMREAEQELAVSLCGKRQVDGRYHITLV